MEQSSGATWGLVSCRIEPLTLRSADDLLYLLPDNLSCSSVKFVNSYGTDCKFVDQMSLYGTFSLLPFSGETHHGQLPVGSHAVHVWGSNRQYRIVIWKCFTLAWHTSALIDLLQRQSPLSVCMRGERWSAAKSDIPTCIIYISCSMSYNTLARSL